MLKYRALSTTAAAIEKTLALTTMTTITTTKTTTINQGIIRRGRHRCGSPAQRPPLYLLPRYGDDNDDKNNDNNNNSVSPIPWCRGEEGILS